MTSNIEKLTNWRHIVLYWRQRAALDKRKQYVVVVSFLVWNKSGGQKNDLAKLCSCAILVKYAITAVKALVCNDCTLLFTYSYKYLLAPQVL